MVPCSSHGMVYPFSVQSTQSFQVILGNKHFGLKPAQGIGAGRLLLQGTVTNHRLHSWISSQPYRIIGVLVSRQTTIHRLPQQGHQLMLHIPAPTGLLQIGRCHLRQSQHLIQFSTGQQPCIRGDLGPVEL